jgi:hypothetical protein
MREIFVIVIKNKFPIHHSMMKMLEAQGNFPKNVTTEEEKHQFILSLMFKNVDKMLEKWDARKENSKHDLDEFEKQKQNIDRKYQEIKDNFSWLKIDSR